MMQALLPAMLVFLGGGVGSLLRWAVGLALPASHAVPEQVGFPWATLAVNLAGCAAIGAAAAMILGDEPVSRNARLLLIVGILGGFTTFSTFGYETLRLLRENQVLAAAIFVGASNLGGIALVWIAHAATSALARGT